LRHRGSRTDLTDAYDIVDFEADNVTSPKFAIDRNIKQGPIAKPAMMVKIEADAP